MINDKNNTVQIYTDGACSGNPGPGGWGAILIYNDNEKEISGFIPDTTNNRMELLAPIIALQNLKKKCNVEIYTDSAYIVNAIEKGWLTNWEKNNWQKKEKNKLVAVKNAELWQILYLLMKIHDIKWIKVKGHSNNELNNRADKLARNEVDKYLK